MYMRARREPDPPAWAVRERCDALRSGPLGVRTDQRRDLRDGRRAGAPVLEGENGEERTRPVGRQGTADGHRTRRIGRHRERCASEPHADGAGIRGVMRVVVMGIARITRKVAAGKGAETVGVRGEVIRMGRRPGHGRRHEEQQREKPQQAARSRVLGGG